MKPVRRSKLAGFALLLAALWACAASIAWAHDGAHGHEDTGGPGWAVHVLSATVTGHSGAGHTVAVEMVLTSLGGPLVLTGLSVEGAIPMPRAPVYVDSAQAVPVSVLLQFATPPAGPFTLDLDFAVAGKGAVLVTPGAHKLSPRP
jgi:hypothetical protein